MQTTQKTKKTTLIEVCCEECGWEGTEADVPYGRDPWDAEGGKLCYCPKCGMVDDLTYIEGE